MTFEEYLREKKIDSGLFREKEPLVWQTWKQEFEQMHPNSFTVQKLNLINPVRRKYPGKIEPVQAPPQPDMEMPPGAGTPPVARPKPVFRPKPKIG